MIGFLLINFVLTQCARPTIENHTKTWNNFDKQTLSRAITRCEFYFPESPCLKKLIKVEERRYQAVCGNP